MIPDFPNSDTPSLTFELETRQITGRRKIAELLIKQRGRIVGVVRPDHGRPFDRIAQARRWAFEVTEELKECRLYVVEITADNIARGEPHSCRQCAVSQALWTTQKAHGISPNEWDFQADTYGAWRDPEGLVLENKYSRDRWHLPADELPLIVTHYRRARKDQWWADSMVDWTMQFDEAHDDHELTRSELKKKNGYTRPTPFPSPAVFVLNADHFEPLEQ